MSLKALLPLFPWSRYSKKMIAKIEKPRSAGFFTKEESEARAMRLAIGKEGGYKEGNLVWLYWLVDVDDGIIVDAKFQVYGQSALIAAAEVACELVIGKNYDQARRIGADLLDKELRDRSSQAAFPPETSFHLNLVVDALDRAAEQCMDIALPTHYAAPPAPLEIGEVLKDGYPGWMQLDKSQQLYLIEELLTSEIRPYIELDAGGVKVVDLKESLELIIIYQGACTSCFSATGTTLSYIQQVLRAKIHPEMA